MKRAIILLLAFVLLVGTMTVPVSASEATEEPNTEIADWSYDNSILVTVTTAEDKVFTPEDFPEVECIRIMHLQKYIEENEYVYELMLQFDDSTFDFDATKEKLLSMEGVLSASRNYYDRDYSKRESYIVLNKDIAYVAIGRSVDLFIDEIDLNLEYENKYFGDVNFVFSSDCLDDLRLLIDEYNINGGVETSINEESGAGTIHDDFGNDLSLLILLSDELIKLSGIESVTQRWEIVDGNRSSENWSVSDSSIAEICLSGGEQKEMDLTPLGQIATVTGKLKGMVNIVVVRAIVSATSVVHVYVPADVNDDGSIDSLDAAAILKHDAGVAQLTEDQLEECDMNGDGEVDSLDAVLLLKYDAGMYN